MSMSTNVCDSVSEKWCVYELSQINYDLHTPIVLSYNTKGYSSIPGCHII